MEHQASAKTNQAEGKKQSACCAKPHRTPPNEAHLFREFQRGFGNRAFGRHIQTKLKVSAPGDAYEQEADRVADQVMRMPDPTISDEAKSTSRQVPAQIQRMCAGCEEEQNEEGKVVAQAKAASEDKEEEEQETIQTKKAPGSASQATTAAPAGIGSGQPLCASERNFFEPRFSQDFSDVRIHNDASAADSARSLNALAYTAGRHIVFAAGHYQPDSSDGRQLLAHELTHVIQQKNLSSPRIHRKIDLAVLSGCSVELRLGVGIYGPRATAALATTWQNWINTLWNGTAACRGNSAGTCPTRVNATVTAHPAINWWWNVPESNSVFVREPDYRSQVNTAVDSGDWAVNEDDRSVAHETGHFMGQGDYYWNIPWTSRPSQSGYVNDIMANYYQDPGPTVYGPALSRILDAHNIECLCCLKYPPCRANSCALSPFVPCANVGERAHCEWIRAHNTPQALARHTTDCSTLRR